MTTMQSRVSTPTGYRETWAEVSLDAIAHNTGLFRKQIAEGCRLMAVVKANGYGHGAVQAAQAAIHAGADCLGVALVDEALQLRAAGISQPILVLGYTPPFGVEAAVRQGITLTVDTQEVLQETIACAKKQGCAARIHLKVDTGMSRIGLSTTRAVIELAELAAAAAPFVILEGVFTHFADADGPDPAYTLEQFARFQACLDALEAHGLHVPIKHCCNSAATMRFPQMHLDLVRIGIALYGLYPSAQLRLPEYPLQQAMQLKTKIASLRRIKPGQTVGYGRTYRAAEERLIATVPIGYADGLSRTLSNRGFALVRGHRVPIIGRVCMDQTMLDVTDVESVQAGEEVILFGGTGEAASISIDEVADWIGTINYEVVCQLGVRVPRVYPQNLNM
ncbi:alanine racemase [Paenibacillus sp. oral taxon 786 str. D14]|uniref:alanine racemase n=1 Tax=Paenibacillus sp. oral taxon 786 TaxID=652715 RepID=UPI0001AFCC04|nr:alanine racemase [Paenibacillus sp. oral taxon 786]EES73609.1 alanine racemase [Paenibacillus sp. oral taxon 786 str. D14]